mgnify:CR=1 FL=1
MAQQANQAPSKLADVQRTHPPHFSSTADPLAADDWLRDIKIKLNLCQCDPVEKATFAAYYLQGASAAWWETYKTLIPPDEPINWTVFWEGFISAHIPPGLMEIKKKEFLNLKQGNMTFMEFMERFNYLGRYVAADMNTEAKKVELCRDRLAPELNHAITAHEITSMKSLVEKALRVESSEKEVVEDRKRKWAAKKFASGSSSTRPRLAPSPVVRPMAPQPPRQMYVPPRPQTQIVHQVPRTVQAAGDASRNDNVACYNCGKKGHYSPNCPYPKTGKSGPHTQGAPQRRNVADEFAEHLPTWKVLG